MDYTAQLIAEIEYHEAAAAKARAKLHEIQRASRPSKQTQDTRRFGQSLHSVQSLQSGQFLQYPQTLQPPFQRPRDWSKDAFGPADEADMK